MRVLFYKELRLLLPVWITAMLLVAAPTALAKLFHYDQHTAIPLTLCAAILGCAILGSAGFGLEFESRTFSLLLVQPRQRCQFWRAKIGALVAALFTIGLALGFFSLQGSKTDVRSLVVALAFEPRATASEKSAPASRNRR